MMVQPPIGVVSLCHPYVPQIFTGFLPRRPEAAQEGGQFFIGILPDFWEVRIPVG